MIVEAGIGVMRPGAEECPQPLDVEGVGNVFCLGVSRSSVGKESACNAGDPRFDSWVGKIHWRRNRLPTPDSWASLVAQLVKNPAAMRETWVRFLGQEDPLEKGKATHLQYSGLENSINCTVHGVTKSQT